eukprot:SAG22_NODE_1703_length_3777_cov_2.072866_3_plen_127_part_00
MPFFAVCLPVCPPGVGFISTTWLLNDMWRFDAKQARRRSNSSLDEQNVNFKPGPLAERLAVCGVTLAGDGSAQPGAARLDRPDVFGLTAQSKGSGGGGKIGMAVALPYPGPVRTKALVCLLQSCLH